ncbi:hypothetical protein NL676_019500 [Syzygium grande]|nr:hypothetical protein NL676_019500 [Syzygium grande]
MVVALILSSSLQGDDRVSKPNFPFLSFDDMMPLLCVGLRDAAAAAAADDDAGDVAGGTAGCPVSTTALAKVARLREVAVACCGSGTWACWKPGIATRAFRLFLLWEWRPRRGLKQ